MFYLSFVPSSPSPTITGTESFCPTISGMEIFTRLHYSFQTLNVMHFNSVPNSKGTHVVMFCCSCEESQTNSRHGTNGRHTLKYQVAEKKDSGTKRILFQKL